MTSARHIPLLVLLVPCSLACACSAPPEEVVVEIDAGTEASVVDGSSAIEAGVPDTGGADVLDAGHAGGVFVAVGYGGRTVRSIDDGKTWIDDQSLVASGGDDAYLLRTVLFANHQFVALGWRRMTSPDGKTWTDGGTIKNTNWFGSAVWDGAQFVGVGGYGMRATSVDAVTWLHHSIDTIASHGKNGLAMGTGAFVSCNDSGIRAHSADGKTWALSTGSATTSGQVVFGNGVFVAFGGTTVLRSTDSGATFQSVATLSAPVSGLVFAQGHFTALANGHVFTSQDGTTWKDDVVAGDQRGPVAFGHGYYVRIGAGGVRMRSVDARVWTDPTPNGPSNHLEMVAFGSF